MKLLIINGENNDEKIEIQVYDDSMVKDIKYKLNEIPRGNETNTKYYFKLIYKNIMLFDDNSIKHYKICENDEIWFGEIEKYLTKDDAIVYAFILGAVRNGDYLIVKKNDTISKIKSIIENFQSKIINIWNAEGKQMRNDQIVTEIDTNENYKLIIRCDDGEGNVINNTFDQCRYLYDKSWMNRYFFWDTIRDDNKNESIRNILISLVNQIRQFISSNDIIDKRLNQNLSDFPSAFLNSTNYFCRDMRTRIVDICNDYWIFVMNQYEDNIVRIFGQYFQFAIHFALQDYSNLSENQKLETNKSMKSIIIDALNYFMEFLTVPSNDWQYWLRLWMDQYLLGSFSDSDVNDLMKENKDNKFSFIIRINEMYTNRFISFKPKLIIEVKQTSSKLLCVDIKHLYCIKPGGDHKPNDKDAFGNDFILEIVKTKKNIVNRENLTRGGFAEVHLCTDNISGCKFVLKKQIRKKCGLYRDISILCRIRNCGNIMNYLGLYNVDDNICMAMQYMSGGSIRSFLDKGNSFLEDDLLKICYQILLQIRDIHKEGIIHRDIRCDNIVLDEHKNAKLIDFGFSKCTECLSDEQLLKNLKAYKPGVIYFMAPEIIRCEKYTNKIDIWSFGATMFEMITGKPPNYHLGPTQAVIHIQNTGEIDYEPLKSVSVEIIELIKICLNPDADARPSAKELIQMQIFLKIKI